MSQAQLFVTLSPFALLLTITCLIFTVVNRQKGRFISLVFFLCETACITLFTALEMTAKSQESLLFFSHLTYTAIAVLPISWVLFCLEYTHGTNDHLVSTELILSIIPSITIAIVWVPFFEPALWSDHAIIQTGNAYFHVVKSYGPWFWVHSAYSYILYFVGIGFILRDFIQMDASRKSQCILNIIGVSFPVASNLIYIFRLIPGIQRDFSILLFSVSGLTFLVSITRYRLLDPRIIEYRNLVETHPKAIVIVDTELAIQDMNDKAVDLLRSAGFPIATGERLFASQIDKFPSHARGKERIHADVSAEDGRPIHAEFTPVTLNKGGLAGFSVQVFWGESIETTSSMSRREQDVYELLAKGCSTKEIAARLCISENTAKTHIKHIYEKNRVNSRKELMDKS